MGGIQTQIRFCPPHKGLLRSPLSLVIMGQWVITWSAEASLKQERCLCVLVTLGRVVVVAGPSDVHQGLVALPG